MTAGGSEGITTTGGFLVLLPAGNFTVLTTVTSSEAVKFRVFRVFDALLLVLEFEVVLGRMGEEEIGRGGGRGSGSDKPLLNKVLQIAKSLCEFTVE